MHRDVGLGLASRGDVRDAVEHARRAEAAGLESVWVHDSYFERDPVSYLSAMAYATREIRLGAGSLNPYTRHPFVVASTLSSLDDLAPERISLALGSGLPLRLMQMGIPFENAPERVSQAIDQVRELWAGRRLVLNDRVPPLVPMFQPPHRIPIYIAAYTRPYLELAGAKADGYLSRPLESLPAFDLMRRRVLESAAAHGRKEAELDFRGYLFALVDRSRAEARNRAKRDPFVIYMISILSDISLKRAGFPAELRDTVNRLWRAEDYHAAAQAIPDELLDAYVLVGTADDVAERALQYHRAGMDVPLLQPIVQEEDQVKAVLQAAITYGSEGRAGASALGTAAATGHAVEREGGLRQAWRRLGAVYEVTRPFSFTASVLPVAAGGVLAWSIGRIDLLPWLLAVIGGLTLHAGTNVVNEVYDVRHGIDSITSPRASLAIVKGRISERGALTLAYACFAVTVLVGLYLTAVRGPWMVVLGAIGLLGGYFYTAPPFHYKYRALGVPLVFLLMGPLMVVGGFFAASGGFDWRTIALSVPVGLLVTAILHGNEWRDIGEDRRLGFTTLSAEMGKPFARWFYVSLLVGAYIAVAGAVMLGLLPTATLLTTLSLPAAVWLLHQAEKGAAGSLRSIAMIDMYTARLHTLFGVLLLAGLITARLLR
ncbi:MAG TPA: LLM class flavin-dependent oxidoreductase [Candidatus Dormibacteraeota bacterium]|nr:LLM class flavin-dependent oxidoreductase [Candidatus Dormibacteraeota bacterium]